MGRKASLKYRETRHILTNSEGSRYELSGSKTSNGSVSKDNLSRPEERGVTAIFDQDTASTYRSRRQIESGCSDGVRGR